MAALLVVIDQQYFNLSPHGVCLSFLYDGAFFTRPSLN